MIEKITPTNNFEQEYNETEKTYIPKQNWLLDQFLDHTAKTIQQPYLSHPSEPYSLRLRHTTNQKSTKIDATLKSRGEIVDSGLSRDEFTAPISLGRYGYYRDQNLPTVRKRRNSPIESIDIDFYADGHSHVESEDPSAWLRFLDEFGLTSADFEDVTGQVFTDNEWRAHQTYRREHGGREAFTPHREFETDVALDSILHYAKSRINVSRARIPVVRLYGRSGSGKSHHLELLRAGLNDQGINSTVISTDDYNVGTTELSKRSGGEHPTSFDTEDVYDLSTARTDAMQLLHGANIRKRQFDFASSEPIVEGEVPAPSDNSVLFVEGLWSRHDIFDFADLTFEVQTPVATSIGRRITRDLVARPEFADPIGNLGYYLEHAEPAYREK